MKYLLIALCLVLPFKKKVIKQTLNPAYEEGVAFEYVCNGDTIVFEVMLEYDSIIIQPTIRDGIQTAFIRE